MKHNVHLLVIDPQNDFCDLPAYYLPAAAPDGVQTTPALPVPGAHADMCNVARLVNLGGAGLSGISVTLDSHHRLDIAHPTFWRAGAGDDAAAPVAPFTQISAAAVRAGRYLPRDPAALPRTLDYLDTLEAAGRYTLMVWPEHCIIGSWGQQLHADVRAALDGWEQRGARPVNQVTKGSNPWTEHYSAIQAEVPDQDDPGTQLNARFIDVLASADRLYITGEAGSHCVRATIEHLVANIDASRLDKLVLLTDCMSAVTGFEAQQQAFIAAMVARGVRTATSADVLPELLANAAH